MCGLRTTRLAQLAALWVYLPVAGAATAEDLAVHMADRTAVERVYASHRIGATQPFEQILPPARIEAMVRDEAKQEAALRRYYNFTITPAQLAAEVKRIDSTTRAPETLAEIKKALGDDPVRFAQTVVLPIIVERELRSRFDNDDKMHTPQRRFAEHARDAALASRKNGVELQTAALKETKSGTVNDVVWQMAPRPAEAERAASFDGPLGLPNSPTSAKAGSSSYSIDATAQVARPLAPSGNTGPAKPYFEDLPPELQRVLGAQLRTPGDVSAVIEISGGFLVFLAKEKTAETLSAASFSVRKRGYEEWLASQPAENP
ncbi:MAG: hypothetical protein ABI680_03090 [Chthoniobacteraceae bacterium]